MKQWLAGILVLFALGFISIWVPAPIAMAGLNSGGGGLSGRGGMVSLGDAQTITGAKTFSAAVSSSVASGSNAFVAETGARWCFNGSTCSTRLSYDGTNNTYAANGGNLIVSGGGLIVSGGGTNINGGLGSQASFQLSIYSGNGSLLLTDAQGVDVGNGSGTEADGAIRSGIFHHTPTATGSLPTCDSTLEGATAYDSTLNKLVVCNDADGSIGWDAAH